MKKNKIPVAVKLEYVDVMERESITSYSAVRLLLSKYPKITDPSQVNRWFKRRELLRGTCKRRARIPGGGRRPLLGMLEDIVYDEVMNLRLQNIQVKRSWIHAVAENIARENGYTEFKASPGWVNRSMARRNLSPRRTTNLTRLTDSEVIERAVSYILFLHKALSTEGLRPVDVVIMDETAVFFETVHRSTVNPIGSKHVMMKTTGFASMRVTALLAVRGDASKCKPFIICKGTKGSIETHSGCWITKQPSAWVDGEILCQWLDLVFPPVRYCGRKKLLVWDSCKAHIS